MSESYRPGPGSISTSEGPTFPSFQEAFWFWLKLGFISFGGPAGQISIMHEFLVEKKRWISEGRFLHALNYCMLLPGPEAQQLATYMGWLLHGTRGGLTAGLLFILPGLVVLLLLSALYVLFGALPLVVAFFNGLKPAVIAIIVVALVKLTRKSLRHWAHLLVAVLAFLMIFFLKVPFPWIVLGAAFIGFIFRSVLPSASSGEEAVHDDSEKEYVINNRTPIASPPTFKSIAGKIGVCLTLWAAPFMVLVTSRDGNFWNDVSLFFTKAAFVTFGGAYAVLPYVAQVSVEKFHWLTNAEMIDGMALGESTPGPLILVLVFVGFMAGYNQFQGSLIGGSIGLAVTAYFTFLPSFLFILIGAPLIERTQANQGIKKALSFVSAAIVGVILNLAIYFGQSVLFVASQPQWYPLAWTVLSFVVLHRFRMNMIWWLLISGLAGVVNYFLLTIFV